MKNPRTPSASKRSNSVSYSKAEIFKKGIKRDPSLFRAFKDKKQFKSWHSHLLTTAGTQDVKEVLDPQYTPQTEEDADLFQLKQEYMYNVADNILQTDRGIVYVCEHEHDHDAQKVFAKVIAYYLKQRAADIEASDLLTYITTAKFGLGKWKGTAVSFISHWEEQVRQYNKLIHNDEKIRDTLKFSLLKTAVADVVEL